MLSKSSRTLKKFSGISVGFFSDGIDKSNENLKGIRLKEIRIGSWPRGKGGTGVAVNMVKTFKNVVENDKEKSDQLCIINILAMDSNGKLPDHSAKSLYDKACLKDAFPVDIVIIPGAPFPIREKTLESLWTTRDKYILITAAKYKDNVLLCPEMIAIGITNFKDDMIRSGVLDFCVPMGQYERMEEGLGAAAGVIAGLLWKIKQSGKYI